MRRDSALPQEKADAVRALARRLMEVHGLVGWAFAFDRSLRRQAACHHPRHEGDPPRLVRPGIITVSVHFAALNDAEQITRTILHEVAHALVGPGHGHDGVWREVCLRIGGDARRHGGGLMPEGKWVASCPACNRRFTRVRRPRNPEGWYCRRCGPAPGSIRWTLSEGWSPGTRPGGQ